MLRALSLVSALVSCVGACVPVATHGPVEKKAPPPTVSVEELLAPSFTPVVVETTALGHLTASVTTSAGTFRFVLDSGASASVIAPATATAMGLQQLTNQFQDMGAFHIGDVSFDGASVVVFDLSGVNAASPVQLDGILGAPFLKAQSACVDVGDETLWVAKDPSGVVPAVDLTSAGFVAVDVVPDHAGLLTLPVDADTALALNAIVDTGATASVLDNDIATSLALQLHNPSSATTVNGAIPSGSATLDAFDLTGLPMHDVEIAVMDLGSFSSQLASVGDKGLDAIVGIDLIRDHGGVVAYPGLHLFMRP